MSKVFSLSDAKARKKKEEHKRLTLRAFDDFEHEDRREQREQSQAVNQAAREKL